MIFRTCHPGRLFAALRRRLARLPCSDRLLGEPPTVALSRAREAFAEGRIENARDAYQAALTKDSWLVEGHVGLALCLLRVASHEQVLACLNRASKKFGRLDALDGLYVKAYLQAKDSANLVLSWNRWRVTPARDTVDFYETTSEILVDVVRHRFGDPARLANLNDDVFDALVYQDMAVDAASSAARAPTVCRLLFQNHEFDRPLYRLLLERLHDWVARCGIQSERNATAATVALAFIGVSDDQARVLIQRFMTVFGVTAHWPYILLASSHSEAFDQSVYRPVNLSITADALAERERTQALGSWLASDLYTSLILATVCRPAMVPRLQEEIVRRVEIQSDLDTFASDFQTIAQAYQKPLADVKPVTRRRLRVAVCISGQLRGYREAFKTWDRLGLEMHDVSFFVHTWRRTGASEPIPPQDARVLPEQLVPAFRDAWNALGEPEMRKRYAEFFDLWKDAPTTVDVETLRTFYGTQHVWVDDDEASPFSEMSNLEKMYYKIDACHTRVEALGADAFDLIIRIRPDWYFLDACRVDWTDVYAQSLGERSIFVDSQPPYFFPGIGYCIGDQFAAGTADVMSCYAGAYGMTQQRRVGQGPHHFPEKFVAHGNVGYACLYSGVKPRVQGMPIRFAPSFIPSTQQIRDRFVACRYEDSAHDGIVAALSDLCGDAG